MESVKCEHKIAYFEMVTAVTTTVRWALKGRNIITFVSMPAANKNKNIV